MASNSEAIWAGKIGPRAHAILIQLKGMAGGYGGHGAGSIAGLSGVYRRA